MKHKTFLFVGLISLMASSSFGANQIPTLFNCGLALEELDTLSGHTSEYYKADIKKKMAELAVLKTPLLMSAIHLDAIKEVLAANKTEAKNDSGPVSNSEKVWIGILNHFKSVIGKPNPEVLTSEERAAAFAEAKKYAISFSQFFDLGQMAQKIDQNPELRAATLDLINNTWAPALQRGHLITTAQERRKFFENMPGSTVEDTKPKVATDEPSNEKSKVAGKEIPFRQIATKIVMTDLRNGQIQVDRHFGENQIRSEKVDLVDFFANEYAILWSPHFNAALRETLTVMGTDTKNFAKSFENYTERDRKDLVVSIFETFTAKYDVYPGALAEDPRALPTERVSQFSEQADKLGQSFEDFYQTRLVLINLQQSPEIHDHVIRLLVEQLRESAELALKLGKYEKNLALRAETLDYGFKVKNGDDSNSGFNKSSVALAALGTSVATIASLSGGHFMAMPFIAGNSLLALNYAGRTLVGGAAVGYGKYIKSRAEKQRQQIIGKAKQSLRAGQSEDTSGNEAD